MSNPLKLAALRWTYASVHGVRIQIPWDSNEPEYGREHFAFAKGTRQQIIAFTEGACQERERWRIRNWMKGENPHSINVGIDCNGFVYRVLDEAAQMSGAPSLEETLGTTCEYTALDTLTPPDLPIRRALDVRAGDTMRFNDGKHSGVLIETVTDEDGHLKEIWYSHSSFTRGPHIGCISVGDPMASLTDPAQNWRDEMWDALADNNLRDLYFTSAHQSPFYQGARPQISKLEGVQVAVAGRRLTFAVPPFILGGRAFCHIRPLAEALGAEVAWDDASQMVTFTQGTRTGRCQVGSEVGVVNGVGYLLDEPPMLIDARVVVPVRFAAEALGYRPEWHERERLVNLVRP